jgi:hypothetical protein
MPDKPVVLNNTPLVALWALFLSPELVRKVLVEIAGE